MTDLDASPHALLPIALALALLAAGCVGGPGAIPDPATPAGPSTPATDAAATSTDTTTTDTTTTDTTTTDTTTTGAATASPNRTVEYVVRTGPVPEEFGGVTVTLRAVVVDRTADLGPCYPEVFTGPYKPTITPLPTPAGECHRSDPVRVELAPDAGDRAVGPFAVPDAAAGHALIVTGVDATDRNGTAVTGIKGSGGAELLAVAERPEGRYGVEIGFEAARPEAEYDYWLVSGRFEPPE